jgi:hypothetical protein
MQNPIKVSKVRTYHNPAVAPTGLGSRDTAMRFWLKPFSGAALVDLLRGYRLRGGPVCSAERAWIRKADAMSIAVDANGRTSGISSLS